MKQSTNPSSLSDEIIEKLIYSGNEQDYKIGVSLLLGKCGLQGEIPTNLDFFFFRKGHIQVYKITGNIQKEIVIGRTGFLIRDIRIVGCKYGDVIKTHWR